ncbi:conserved hypothetical protein [Desulforapulum autotrophicum HRM2]|uniref:Uncharacterized protein n=1 Tax=Desulforapulum autotrophicum (strain ATCC 43914 / DSM 3382 / VKM B-1955 / HRM2) TaxID=177437 RepID=C0Q8N2_DESAH|nr:DUF523 domain-containing protein [Desulforapulum autotrophicum]ACN14372.1 conserved hypothetical protein [Desulforapulum autotrophicum HRM2]
MVKPIRIGISACLLGNYVRYDGNHSHDPLLLQTLGPFVDYVAVCPEVECGMTTPREPIILMGDPENPRLVTRDTGVDRTDQMVDWAQNRSKALEQENLCGFIFKNKSPSCGLFRVKVFDAEGGVTPTGRGLFARAFTRRFPTIPVEESQRLQDPELMADFIESLLSFQERHPCH